MELHDASSLNSPWASLAYNATAVLGFSSFVWGVAVADAGASIPGLVSLIAIAVIRAYELMRNDVAATARAAARVWEEKCQECESKRTTDLIRHGEIERGLRDQIEIERNNVALLRDRIIQRRLGWRDGDDDERSDPPSGRGGQRMEGSN